MTTLKEEHPLEAEFGGSKLEAPKVRVRKFKKDYTTYFLESVHEKFHSDAHEQYRWLLRKNRRAAEIQYTKTSDPGKDDVGIRISLSPLSAKTQVFTLDYQLKGSHEMYEPWGTEWIKIGNPLMPRLYQILKELDALQLYRVVASMEEWLKQPITKKVNGYKTYIIKRGLEVGEAFFSPLIESVDTDVTADSYISATSGKVRGSAFPIEKKHHSTDD
jgi:hypothetical protein